MEHWLRPLGREVRALAADLRSHYQHRRVLITGHTGFKGSWLALWLKRLGATVGGVALTPPTTPSLFAALDGARLVDRHVLMDIRALGSLKMVFDDFQPEFVFHLAAQSLVRASYEDPITTFDTNVTGTANILECVRLTPTVRVLVCISSDKCYENREWTWGYRENDRLGGRDPYAASKAAAELVVGAYRESFFSSGSRLGCASARAGNCIGGGDWATDRIVPDCVRALAAGKRIAVRNPEAVRPWQHVLEPVGAYLLLGAALEGCPDAFSSAWNFGPVTANAATVRTLVTAFIEGWGGGDWDDLSGAHGVAPHEASTLMLNCDKAHRQLDWRPRWNLERTVKETIVWYKEWYARGGSHGRDLCEQQIEAYEATAPLS